MNDIVEKMVEFYDECFNEVMDKPGFHERSESKLEIMKLFLEKFMVYAQSNMEPPKIYPSVKLEKEMPCSLCGKMTIDAIQIQSSKMIIPACIECAPTLIDQIE